MFHSRLTLREGGRLMPLWRHSLRFVAMVLAAVAVEAALLWLYLSVLGLPLPKTALLRGGHDAWQARYDVLDLKLDVYESQLSEIESRNDLVYRTIFALDPVPDSLLVGEFPTQASFVSARAGNLHSRIETQMTALGEVGLVAKEAGDMASHIPAIPPLLTKKGNFHLSSPFGVRTDPIYGTAARHLGQDFAARKGTPVYATGDGVVSKVDFKYSGYGNEVIIDHGFGYQSRYAHLSVITTGEGETIHRGDKIGEVGRSGKATGPHLHYEVLYKGSQINPTSFMDASMPEDEYRALLRKRNAENVVTSSGHGAASISERQQKQGTSGR